ncbi:hypothetical protein DL93DRAFT_2146650, partial [Clavulina sp. PMI_390]
MLAIYYAARHSPHNATLCILTDSMWSINALTKYLSRNEDQGYLEVANADLIQATAATLRMRTGHTLFKWVKGHNGTAGNEGADRLAAQGANKPRDDTPYLPAPMCMIPMGMRLECATQSLVYKALCKLTSPEERERTVDLLDRTRENINETWGVSPTNERIWNALHKSEHISRSVKQFLWKCQHGTLKIGSHWAKMPGYENRAECSLCGELETIDHILFGC